ncbi:MAG: hypothetical protein ACPIB4_09505 [Candidatus Puniceispirillaceae bacterium]
MDEPAMLSWSRAEAEPDTSNAAVRANNNFFMEFSNKQFFRWHKLAFICDACISGMLKFCYNTQPLEQDPKLIAKRHQ